MLRKLDYLISGARKASVLIKNFHGSIRVVSHYDADGIAAASIISIALSREGKQFRLSIVKQLSEGKLKQLAEEGNLLTVFTDLGSGHLKSVQDNLIPGAKAIILDHHQIKGEIDPERESVIHVNPLLFGINENLSGAGVAYLLARELDADNIDLSYLGVVGAVGDSQMGSIEENWGLSGPNKEILKDARKSGKLTISRGLRIWGRHTRSLHKALEFCTDPVIPGVTGSESAAVQFLTELGIPLKRKKAEDLPSAQDEGEEWRTLSDLSEEEQKTLASGIIKQRIGANCRNPLDVFGDVYEIPSHPEEFRSVAEFATVLNACGKLGRHYTGISMCAGNPGSFEDAIHLLSAYRKDIGKAISWVNQNRHVIRTTGRCTYMVTGSRVSEHIISNLVSIFNKSGFVPENKPVFAFANAEEGMVKVSGRAHDMLVENGINMERLVSEAAIRSGGEGGGHKGAAGATIPRDSQEVFISYIEEMMDQKAKHDLSNATQNNINIKMPEEQTLEKSVDGRRQGTPSVKQFVVEYGTAESQRGQSGSEGREEGAETPGIRQAGPAEGSRFEKMEGQGLVRYFGPKNV